MSIRPALGSTIFDIDLPVLHTSLGSLELTLIREINFIHMDGVAIIVIPMWKIPSVDV